MKAGFSIKLILYFAPNCPRQIVAPNCSRQIVAPNCPDILQPLLCLRCTRSLERTPKNRRQFVHPPNPPLNFTYPPLALSSATYHSRLKTELFKISYSGSTPAPPHVRYHHRLQL